MFLQLSPIFVFIVHLQEHNKCSCPCFHTIPLIDIWLRSRVPAKERKKSLQLLANMDVNNAWFRIFQMALQMFILGMKSI